MRNPIEILTEDGYMRYITHIYNMRMAWEYIQAHASDLQFYDYEDIWFGLKDVLDKLEKGPFESED